MTLGQTLVTAAAAPVNPNSAETQLPDGRVDAFRTDGGKDQDLANREEKLHSRFEKYKELKVNNPPFYLVLPEKAPAVGMIGRLPSVQVQQVTGATDAVVERTYHPTAGQTAGTVMNDFRVTGVDLGNVAAGGRVKWPDVFQVTGTGTVALTTGSSVAVFTLQPMDLTQYLRVKPVAAKATSQER